MKSNCKKLNTKSKTCVSTKATINRILAYFHEYKKEFIFVSILGIVASLLSTFAIYGTGYIYNEFIVKSVSIVGQVFLIFLFILLAMLACWTISNVFNFIQSEITITFGEKGTYKMRKELFSKLHSLPIKYFDQTPSGEIMTRVSNDVDNISNLVCQYVGNLTYWVFSILFCTILMFLLNWFLALITLLILPIMVFLNYLVVGKVQPFFIKQQNSVSKLNGFAEEMISGTKIVSLFKMQKPILEVFDDINDDLTKNSIIAQASTNLMMPVANFSSNLAFFIITALGLTVIMMFCDNLRHLSLLGSFELFSLLIIFTSTARKFTDPILNIVSTFSYLFLSIASAERIFEILDQKPEKDKKGAKPLTNFKGEITAKNLCFGYEPNRLVLKNLNFTAPAGHMFAIVGPTGAGKTTIVNLITKFYNLTSGDLLIDNVSISDITMKSLRQNITMVLQETYLFAQTVRENIRYGRLDATDEEIIVAAKEANAHDFIMQLPDGYNTVLKDNGVDLSQGQRQLLAIARSFLSKPKIVILDEATSSIDTKTELKIANATLKLMKGKTSFVIAHRLSTIKNAHCILVLNYGEIVEMGSHKQLMAKNGFYADLYNTQYKKGKVV